MSQGNPDFLIEFGKTLKETGVSTILNLLQEELSTKYGNENAFNYLRNAVFASAIISAF